MRLAARHAAKQALLQKQRNAVNKLRDVEVSVNRLQFEGHDLFQLVAEHAVKLAAAAWFRRAFTKNSTALGDAQLRQATERLAYAAGMMSENLFHEMQRLDGIAAGLGAHVKCIRKRLVSKILLVQEMFDSLRRRALSLLGVFSRVPLAKPMWYIHDDR